VNRRTALDLVWGALVWAVAAAPLWWSPALLTGYERGEADNHRWMLWQAAHPTQVWSNLPDGTGMPLVDPVHLPVFWVGLLFGPTFAWNLTLGVDLVIAVAGGAYLAVRATDRREVAPVGMMLALAPALHGVVAFGVSEAWTLGWLAFFLGGWAGFVRSGRRLDAVVAAAGLGGYLLSGGYAWFFAVISIALAAAWARPSRERLPLALLILGSGAIVAVPAMAQFWAARAVWADRLHPVISWRTLVGWRDGPEGGSDLLMLVIPRLPVPAGRSTYLGVASLLLATAGVRRQAGAAVAVAVFGLLSLGVVVHVAGHAVVPGVAMLPSLAGFHWIHHWYRATGPMAVWLIPLVAQGAIWLADGKRRIPPWMLAAVVGVDVVALGGNTWPASQYDPTPPPGIRDLGGAGGLLVLPLDREGEFTTDIPRPFERWGPEIGRPLAMSYETPVAMRDRVRLVAALDRACGAADDARPFSDPAGVTPEIAAAGRRQLAAAGVTDLAVWTVHAPIPDLCRAVAMTLLGAPDRVLEGGVLSWRMSPPP
jgi:hypothetical protein